MIFRYFFLFLSIVTLEFQRIAAWPLHSISKLPYLDYEGPGSFVDPKKLTQAFQDFDLISSLYDPQFGESIEKSLTQLILRSPAHRAEWKKLVILSFSPKALQELRQKTTNGGGTIESKDEGEWIRNSIKLVFEAIGFQNPGVTAVNTYTGSSKYWELQMQRSEINDSQKWKRHENRIVASHLIGLLPYSRFQGSIKKTAFFVRLQELLEENGTVEERQLLLSHLLMAMSLTNGLDMEGLKPMLISHSVPSDLILALRFAPWLRRALALKGQLGVLRKLAEKFVLQDVPEVREIYLSSAYFLHPWNPNHSDEPVGSVETMATQNGKLSTIYDGISWTWGQQESITIASFSREEGFVRYFSDGVINFSTTNSARLGDSLAASGFKEAKLSRFGLAFDFRFKDSATSLFQGHAVSVDELEDVFRKVLTDLGNEDPSLSRVRGEVFHPERVLVIVGNNLQTFFKVADWVLEHESPNFNLSFVIDGEAWRNSLASLKSPNEQSARLNQLLIGLLSEGKHEIRFTPNLFIGKYAKVWIDTVDTLRQLEVQSRGQELLDTMQARYLVMNQLSETAFGNMSEKLGLYPKLLEYLHALLKLEKMEIDNDHDLVQERMSESKSRLRVLAHALKPVLEVGLIKRHASGEFKSWFISSLRINEFVGEQQPKQTLSSRILCKLGFG